MSRYSICKETLLTNLKYAKQKSIPIIIILFDHSVRLYTNIVFGESTNQLIKTKLEDKCKVNDNLTYDQIMTEINNSHPLGSTDFIIPFEVLKCIEELDTTSEIFFLSEMYCFNEINARTTAILTFTAFSLLKTEANIVTPCSVKA